MNCPACHSESARRSRRRSAGDFLLSATGAVPWRCTSCQTRFHARPLPIRDLFYAHCSTCGNLELEPILPAHVVGLLAPLGRTLGLPALRSEPCRKKFFSIRPLRTKSHAETGDSPR